MADKIAELKIRKSLGRSGGWNEKNDERFFDSTTGAFNRDALNTWGQIEMNMAKRHKIPLTVVMFDIDAFKSVNDRLGHLNTDKLLKKTIGDLKDSLRKIDLLFRYGGDEFVIFLLDCDQFRAQKYILPEVEKVFLKNTLTISTGMQEVGNYTNLEDVLGVVDKRLYVVKEQKKHE